MDACADVEAPTGIEPVASWVEARCSIQMSYGATKGVHGLAWTVSNRSTSPMSRGRSAAELQAMAAAPGFEPGPTEVTARRATVLHHAAVEERERDSNPRASARAPTYLGSNQAPSPDLGISPEEEGERVERSCRLITGFRFRDGGPCQWAIPPYV